MFIDIQEEFGLLENTVMLINTFWWNNKLKFREYVPLLKINRG